MALRAESAGRAGVGGELPEEHLDSLVVHAEVADAVVWLLRPEARGITGHALPIDGGGLALPISRFAGVYSAALATVPFLPARYGVGDALNRATTFVAGDLGFNMLREFWPEIKRALLHGRFKPVS